MYSDNDIVFALLCAQSSWTHSEKGNLFNAKMSFITLILSSDLMSCTCVSLCVPHIFSILIHMLLYHLCKYFVPYSLFSEFKKVTHNTITINRSKCYQIQRHSFIDDNVIQALLSVTPFSELFSCVCMPTKNRPFTRTNFISG